MKYRWVERSEKLTPFGGDFDTSEEALSWGREQAKSGFATPEHMHIFLITVDGRNLDIFRKQPGDVPINFGSLWW